MFWVSAVAWICVAHIIGAAFAHTAVPPPTSTRVGRHTVIICSTTDIGTEEAEVSLSCAIQPAAKLQATTKQSPSSDAARVILFLSISGHNDQQEARMAQRFTASNYHIALTMACALLACMLRLHCKHQCSCMLTVSSVGCNCSGETRPLPPQDSACHKPM